ncbi:MAG TPA: methylated-DNA--[protein]-cysteine S-methyltransferase [Candidatus Avidehalobacter gallistercoris]|uniref:Methylated-DNA--protein-cysteine methyltransferase n=1 Tax=Candidatus Avidehalobacter gallistercoris TaxID=2840694 RepID=A0A9D1HKV4_9FIRM|nr:methylated-DNA--[protein]-cysteine S-methyltransferase [Candidatus Avidehalobacter gallistercoris]
MQYTTTYQSPLGAITLAADGEALTGLWFEGQKYYALYLDKEHEEKDLPVFQQAKEWLNIYFSGKDPDFTPPLRFTGSAFQNEVWAILAAIPYGKTRTYGDIAQELAQKRGLPRMSAQAVGGAVGKNEISIIVPCHRVVGANGSLTGYAGGISKKIALLKLEGAFKEAYFIPKHSTAP